MIFYFFKLKYNLFTEYLGEGNDSPLQYSCLEKPVDKGAWWAAVQESEMTEET